MIKGERGQDAGDDDYGVVAAVRAGIRKTSALKSFLDAMVISRFREQYVDALSVYLREQEVAGLDIVTDGDCRFDQDVGGQSWTSYPPHHMEGSRRRIRSWRRSAPAASGFRAATSCTTTSRRA